jgi:hypothetical protein
MNKRPYPEWICSPCGRKHGRREAGIASWHEGVCGLCQAKTSVTEPRDFGHLKDYEAAHDPR